MKDKIIFTVGQTTGRQLVRRVMAAVKEKQSTQSEFCRLARIGRMSLNRCRKGEKPRDALLLRVANGLSQWGYDVAVEYPKA